MMDIKQDWNLVKRKTNRKIEIILYLNVWTINSLMEYLIIKILISRRPKTLETVRIWHLFLYSPLWLWPGTKSTSFFFEFNTRPYLRGFPVCVRQEFWNSIFNNIAFFDFSNITCFISCKIPYRSQNLTFLIQILSCLRIYFFIGKLYRSAQDIYVYKMSNPEDLVQERNMGYKWLYSSNSCVI